VGYRPKTLAVRSIQGVSSAKLFRLHLFWVFTLSGLTVPYRIWFNRHCDFLRVTVVKETSANPPPSYWTAAGKWLPSRATIQPHVKGEHNFRSFMTGQALYGKEIATQSNAETMSKADAEDIPPSPSSIESDTADSDKSN
jgi:hypothetical protein